MISKYFGSHVLTIVPSLMTGTGITTIDIDSDVVILLAQCVVDTQLCEVVTNGLQVIGSVINLLFIERVNDVVLNSMKWLIDGCEMLLRTDQVFLNEIKLTWVSLVYLLTIL